MQVTNNSGNKKERVARKNDERSLDDAMDQLSTAVQRIFRPLLKLAIQSLLIARKRTGILAVCLIGGIIGGLVHSRVYDKPTYESHMLLRSSFVDSTLMKKTIGDLDVLSEEILWEELNIDRDMAACINGFSVDYSIDSTFTDDSQNSKGVFGVFDIKVRSSAQLDFGVLNNNVVGYLLNRPFVKTRYKEHRDKLVKLESRLRQELQEYDTLKAIALGGLVEKKMIDLSEHKDPLLVNPHRIGAIEVQSKALALYEQMLETAIRVEYGEPITLISGFSKEGKLIEQAPLVPIGYGGLVGLAISVLMISLIQLNIYLKRIESAVDEQTPVDSDAPLVKDDSMKKVAS